MKREHLKGLVVSVAAAALVGLSGCGGGGGDDSSQAGTGTGYYLDSAVAGVDYVCGSQTGKTGKDGSFIFEEGKPCSFELGNVPLRSVPADELANNAKIVENNVTVAELLQSVDADGDASNGIQIKDEVVAVLKKTLQKVKSVEEAVQKLPQVIKEIKQEVPDFNGTVKTPDEVKKHLKQTHENLIKELLSGKTFYVVGVDDGKAENFKVKFDEELTQITEFDKDGKEKTENITIEGNKLTFDSDDDGSYTVITGFKGDYIELVDFNGDGTIDGHHRLYSDKAKADAYYKSLTKASSDLKSLLGGKTLYIVGYGKDGWHGAGSAEFDVELTSVHYKGIWNDSDDDETYEIVAVVGNKLVWSDKTYTVIGENRGDYIEAIDYNAEGTIDGTSRLYFDRSKAEAYFNNIKDKVPSGGDENDSSYYHLQTSDIAGHTIRVGDPSKDKQFNNDGTFTSLEAEENERDTGRWSITKDGKLLIVWDSNQRTEIYSFSAKPATGVTLTNETFAQSGKITQYL